MKVLVTGGCGYIGSHVVYALLDAGHTPFVLDDLSTGHRHLIPESIPLLIRDLCSVDPDYLSNYLEGNDIEAVMHFAGSIVVPESVKHPLDYWSNNFLSSHNLLSVMVDAGVNKLVFSSTAAVYGDPLFLDPTQLDEDFDLNPINPYGESKLAVEKLIRGCHKAHGIDYGILRYFNVAGADNKGRTGQISPKSTHLIKLACEAMIGKKRRSLSIAGDDYPTMDGTCVRDYIHVSDLATAHVNVLDYISKGQSITANVGYGRGFSVKEVLQTAQLVQPFDVIQGPRREGDPASLVANSTLIREVVGWKPEHEDLLGIIRDAYNWESKLDSSPKVV